MLDALPLRLVAAVAPTMCVAAATVSVPLKAPLGSMMSILPAPTVVPVPKSMLAPATTDIVASAIAAARIIFVVAIVSVAGICTAMCRLEQVCRLRSCGIGRDPRKRHARGGRRVSRIMQHRMSVLRAVGQLPLTHNSKLRRPKNATSVSQLPELGIKSRAGTQRASGVAAHGLDVAVNLQLG